MINSKLFEEKKFFLRKYGNQTIQSNINNQNIQAGDSLDKSTLDDYGISDFNAGASESSNYPATDTNTDNTGEDYILILGEQNFNTDANGGDPNTQTMTKEKYDTYQFFSNYPYVVDEDGNIINTQMKCNPISQEYVQSSSTVNRKPKTLVGQTLTLENANEFCSE